LSLQSASLLFSRHIFDNCTFTHTTTTKHHVYFPPAQYITKAFLSPGKRNLEHPQSRIQKDQITTFPPPPAEPPLHIHTHSQWRKHPSRDAQTQSSPRTTSPAWASPRIRSRSAPRRRPSRPSPPCGLVSSLSSSLAASSSRPSPACSASKLVRSYLVLGHKRSFRG
ncbi:hypothetical protein CT0861_07308, partial [Colletotrichum tofieldiae]